MKPPPPCAAPIVLSVVAGIVTGFIGVVSIIFIGRYIWRRIKAWRRPAGEDNSLPSAEESPPTSPGTSPGIWGSPGLSAVTLPVSQSVLAEFIEDGASSPAVKQAPRSLLNGPQPLGRGQAGPTALQVLTGASK